ncbi:class I SAM-dependent methyltransferase [Marinomonas epiphytica]
MVSLYTNTEADFLNTLKAQLLSWTSLPVFQNHNFQSILVQHRYQTHSPTECIWGVQEEYTLAIEEGLFYKLDLMKNQNTGLFLDMRFGRNWVKENSAGKNVLNLFAYTCGFSVAAMAGKAKQVINFDMAKGALNRGRENHRLNQIDTSKVHFFAHDILKSWGKIRKYGSYDLIIIDPPTFQKGSFAITKDYQKILRRLPDLLKMNGQVLACVNDPNLDSQFLISAMLEAAPKLKYQFRLDNPPEFQDIHSESGLKALIFQNCDS